MLRDRTMRQSRCILKDFPTSLIRIAESVQTKEVVWYGVMAQQAEGGGGGGGGGDDLRLPSGWIYIHICVGMFVYIMFGIDHVRLVYIYIHM